MDICTGDSLTNYPMQQLPGSIYWIPDTLFDALLLQTSRNLRRAGFRILVAHGHGPSNQHFSSLRNKIENEIGLICISPFDFIQNEHLGFQNDHAAANETSITMAVRPDLVHMEYLSQENEQLAMAGRSPIKYASPAYGQELLETNLSALETGISKLLTTIL